MASTTLTLPYVRFVRQVTSGPGSLPQFVAMMQDALVKLKAAPWVNSKVDLTAVAMPANQPLSFTLDEKYDAFKASSTVAASGVETVYAGMAAYRFKIPSDATSNNKYIRNLSINVGADKFAYSGIKIAVHASNTATPSEDWDMLRIGGYGSTLDVGSNFATYDASPEVYGVLTGHVASVADATNQAGTLSFDLSALGNTNYSYLWVYVSMFDYTDYRANRPYWVEGSGIVNGATNIVTFSSAVTEDASLAWDGWTKADGRHSATGSATGAPWLGRFDAGYQVSMSAASSYPETTQELVMSFPEGSTTSTYASSTITAPTLGDTSNTQAATGTVGVYNSTTIKGFALFRHLVFSKPTSITKIKFSGSGGSVMTLSSKTIRVMLNVWASDGLTSSMDWSSSVHYWSLCKNLCSAPGFTGTLGAPNPSLDSYFYSLLSKNCYGNESSAVVRFYQVAGTAVYSDITFSKVASFALEGQDVTSNTIFPIPALSCAKPIKTLLFTLCVQDYWGTIGSATYTTFTPGNYIYVQ